MILIISAAATIIFIFAVYLRIKKRKQRFFKEIKKSPDLATLLNYAQNKKVRVLENPIQKSRNKNGHEWLAYPLKKIIFISTEQNSIEILPKDPFLQKIIFAHEIIHTEQKNKYLKIISSCKQFTNPFFNPPCLYLEQDAWEKAFKLLENLNLFCDEKEKREFWSFVRSKPDDPKFSHCLRKIENAECPETLRMRQVLKSRFS